MRPFTRALLVFVVLSILTGLAYPFAITGLARLLFPEKAMGSLVLAGGKVVGSSLIGQKFTTPQYFHGRPSASDYDATNSGGTNFGPSNAKFIEEVAKRISKNPPGRRTRSHCPCPGGLGPRVRERPRSRHQPRGGAPAGRKGGEGKGAFKAEGIGPRPGLGRPPLRTGKQRNGQCPRSQPFPGCPGEEVARGPYVFPARIALSLTGTGQKRYCQ